MDVRNCRSCGRMFNYIGRPICANCMNALEDKFQEVKKYIEDNPSANITMVAEETGVSTTQLKNWVREERLSFSDSSLVGLNCEGCGTMIKMGRFCDECKMKLGNALSNSIRTPEAPAYQKKQKESARMRFLDNK